MRTVTGRVLQQAIETDFDARNGRAPAPGSLPPPVEAAWRVVVAERLKYENEMQEKAVADAAKGRRT